MEEKNQHYIQLPIKYIKKYKFFEHNCLNWNKDYKWLLDLYYACKYNIANIKICLYNSFMEIDDYWRSNIDFDWILAFLRATWNQCVCWLIDSYISLNSLSCRIKQLIKIIWSDISVEIEEEKVLSINKKDEPETWMISERVSEQEQLRKLQESPLNSESNSWKGDEKRSEKEDDEKMKS